MPSFPEKRVFIAAVLYPVVQSFLFGSAVVLLAVGFPAMLGSGLAYAVIFSVVMAAPLSWDLAPLLSLELSGRGRLARLRAGKR